MGTFIELGYGDGLKMLAEEGIGGDFVDLIITDLPYEEDDHRFRTHKMQSRLWHEFDQILAPEGVVIIFSRQPFTSRLVISKLDWYKYGLIWKYPPRLETGGSKNRAPARTHEDISVFYRLKGAYHHDKERPGSVFEFPRSQKPEDGKRGRTVELYEFLIKAYSKSGDIVFDPYMGMGNSGVAAVRNDRNFIGYSADAVCVGRAHTRIYEERERRKLSYTELEGDDHKEDQMPQL